MKERMYVKVQKLGGTVLFYRHWQKVGIATVECKQGTFLDA